MLLFHTISFCDGLLTVFDLRQVPHHHVSHRNLDDISFPHDSELLLLLDPTLQTPELLLFGPVIERRDQDDTHDRQQDGRTLDPAGVTLAFLLARRHVPTCCGDGNGGMVRYFFKYTTGNMISQLNQLVFNLPEVLVGWWSG